MTYAVGSKGQVVIAKELRDRLGVKPGWIALQRLSGDHLEVYFFPPAHRNSLKGSLATHLKRRPDPHQTWDEAREAAWRSAAHDRGFGPEEAS